MVVFVLDIATKALALDRLRAFQPVEVIPGFFNLSLVFNRGAEFGILPGRAGIFMALAAATILAMLLFAWFNKKAPAALKIALGLICGGAAGNLLDRIRFGHVVDFLDFYVSRWHWPAFNIADSSICVGAGLLLLHSLRRSAPGPA